MKRIPLNLFSDFHRLLLKSKTALSHKGRRSIKRKLNHSVAKYFINQISHVIFPLLFTLYSSLLCYNIHMRKIFLLLILLLTSAKVFAADYYLVGIDAFKKGVYDKAESNLVHAVRINYKNVNARYYLAQTYLKQNRIFEAEEQYNRIMLLSPDSDAAMLSAKGLSLIRYSQNGKGNTVALSDNLAAYQDNYLDYVLPSNGKIMKWASFPLTVYIEPKSQKGAAQKAFEQWQAKTGNLVSFKFVNSPVKAQIVVDFKDKLENSTSDKSYIAGYSKPYYQGNNIIKSEIHILGNDPDTNQRLSDDSITFSTLHEIGHSLGFRGHSPDGNDIMSATSTQAKPALTQRDINTMAVFYKIDNKSLLARNKGATDVQLQQALDYVKKIPDKAVGWTNLGDIYRSKKMYSDAIKNYKKAISIEPDKAETYNLLGGTYSEFGDNQSAFTNLKKACDMDKSNTFYLYQFAQLCFNTGKKDTGKAYLNAFLKANPQEVTDEQIQNLQKLYK